jgi:hypothetical protein
VGVEAGEELAIVEREDRGKVVRGLLAGAIRSTNKLGMPTGWNKPLAFTHGSSLHLHGPVRGQESLDNVGLPVQEIVEDRPGRA